MSKKMKKSASSVINPKLIISEYFDSLIRQIDIYTEKKLKHFTDKRITKMKPGISLLFQAIEREQKKQAIDGHIDIDSYDTNFDAYKCWQKISEPDPIDFRDENIIEIDKNKSIKCIEYLNQVRDELIKELEKGQKEAFEYYETIKDEINRDMTQDEIESRLFKRGNYFLVTPQAEFRNDPRYHAFNMPFKMNLVKIDFHLNCRERIILCHLLTWLEFKLNGCFKRGGFYDSLSFVHLKEYLLAESLKICLHDYLSKQLGHSQVTPLIYIQRKKHLAQIRTLDVNFEEAMSIELDESCHLDMKYDFSNLKSLIFSSYTSQKDVLMKNLNTLTELENLVFIENKSIKKLSHTFFSNLSLCRMNLKGCDFESLDANFLASFTRLSMLEINECPNCDHVNLDVLPRLEWLIIKARSENECPIFCDLSQESLRGFELNLKTTTSADFKLLREFKHKSLVVLKIELTDWKLIDHRDWLSGFPSLKSLNLTATNDSNTSYQVFPNLVSENLESLSLSGLSEPVWDNPGMFMGVKKLTLLDLSRNKINQIHPDTFRGLARLKSLVLECNNLTTFESDQFSHLEDLEHLDLTYNQISRIESQLLANLSKLKTLNLSNNSIVELPDDIFASTTNIQQVDLTSNPLNEENYNKIEQMFTNIEFIRSLKWPIEDLVNDQLATLNNNTSFSQKIDKIK